MSAPVHNPNYTKFDLVKDCKIPEADVRRIHSGKVSKKSFLGLNKIIPAQRDPLLGLQLDQKEDGTVVVTGMKLLSPFQETRLEVGFTIICINGIHGPWESAEACGKVIADAEDEVHIIFADLKDGHFMEFVDYRADGTPDFPEKPDTLK
jgi:predicted metalloprotease with PDZ domain